MQNMELIAQSILFCGKIMSDIRYTAQVQMDSDGELLLSFPNELLNQMGWDIGDKLIWEELPGGSYSVRKDSDE